LAGLSSAELACARRHLKKENYARKT
jgi:hypothetical protein